MTASIVCRLREIHAERRRLDEEEARLLVTLESGAPQARPAMVEKPDRWLDTARAARIAGVTYQTIYRWCRRYQLGERSSSGCWRISENALRAFMGGSRVEDVQDVHVGRVSLFNDPP